MMGRPDYKSVPVYEATSCHFSFPLSSFSSELLLNSFLSYMVPMVVFLFVPLTFEYLLKDTSRLER
jgi:hypothetical protein